MAVRVVKQKGTAIRSTLRAIEKVHGKVGLQRVKDTLDKTLLAQIEPVLLPVNWYPIAVSAGLHAAIRDALARGSWEESHALGVQAAHIDFTGVYRVLLRAVQYDTIWSRMEVTWNHLISQGAFTWYERKDGYVRARIYGVEGFNRGIWNAAAGRGEGLMQLSGAKSASVVVLESTGQDCIFEGYWVV